MNKQLLVAALLTLICLVPQSASAQLPGGLPRIPRPGKPKSTATPVPTETAQPAPSSESRPAASPAASSVTAPSQAAAGSGAVAVLKNLVVVDARTVTSYKGDSSTFSWTPVIKFDTNGNTPSGAQFYATVSLQSGAPWVEMDCKWSSSSQKSYYQCGGPDFPESKGTTATGVFPFVIKMRNELQGTDQTLFTGRVKIEKAPDDTGTPAERAKKSFFYPNMDWALPVGYVFYSPADNHLYTAFWVRGSTYKVDPHVFYQGKEIGLQGMKPSCNDKMEVGDAYIRSIKPAPFWKLVECDLTSAVQIRDKGETFGIPIHYLMSNPGEYEIKVLWNDELSRSIKFTVSGGDFTGGVPLLYRVRQRDGDRLPGVIVPVTILDAQDGPWNKAAWKTDAFYGNPPQGLTPAP
jgi:hypothetical protein